MSLLFDYQLVCDVCGFTSGKTTYGSTSFVDAFLFPVYVPDQKDFATFRVVLTDHLDNPDDDEVLQAFLEDRLPELICEEYGDAAARVPLTGPTECPKCGNSNARMEKVGSGF